jgi:beta-phosphoglucomutase family hydrolase
MTSLGLPDGVSACLFDMDGVLTKTATVHEKAWKEMFESEGYGPFSQDDYNEYVDGLPREEGVRKFLASRGKHPDDAEIARLGDRKNDIVGRVLDRDGVEVYDGSVRYVRAARDAGLRRAVVSSSANTRHVLEVAGILDLFEAIVDGNTIKERGLHGKPAPDTFLAGARELGAGAEHAAVFEDALAGVAAGRAGGFGHVIGVDRVDQAAALREHGADVVVEDLAELL